MKAAAKKAPASKVRRARLKRHDRGLDRVRGCQSFAKGRRGSLRAVQG
jgi:hypothetical protein